MMLFELNIPLSVCFLCEIEEPHSSTDVSSLRIRQNGDSSQGCDSVGMDMSVVIRRMDKQNESICKEFEAIQTILDESIKLGLLWDVSVIDLNEKRDPVAASHH